MQLHLIHAATLAVVFLVFAVASPLL